MLTTSAQNYFLKFRLHWS